MQIEQASRKGSHQLPSLVFCVCSPIAEVFCCEVLFIDTSWKVFHICSSRTSYRGLTSKWSSTIYARVGALRHGEASHRAQLAADEIARPKQLLEDPSIAERLRCELNSALTSGRLVACPCIMRYAQICEWHCHRR